MYTVTDEELIEQFKNGNVGAFNRLIRRWQDKMFAFAYRYVGSTEEAKDICQNAFIRAYKNLKKLKDTARFSSWMYQITLNLCKDSVKSRGRKRTVSIDHEWENEKGEQVKASELLSENPSQVTGVENTEASLFVRKALNLIPDEQRVVIIMKEYQGMKFIEIAEILKIPINTVKSRMYYGLKNIRESLAKLKVGREELLNEG